MGPPYKRGNWMRRWIGFLFLLGGLAAARTQPEQWERGLASWYGAPYDGQRAASGEIYHQEAFTAAHRTLPFGSLVRVHRLDQRRSVVVRINDRGPFVPSRVIDLSHAAARWLGIVTRGDVPVALEVVENPTPAEDRVFSIELPAPRDAVWDRPQ